MTEKKNNEIIDNKWWDMNYYSMEKESYFVDIIISHRGDFGGDPLLRSSRVMEMKVKGIYHVRGLPYIEKEILYTFSEVQPGDYEQVKDRYHIEFNSINLLTPNK